MLEFRVLGPIDVLLDGKAVAVSGGKRRALLAALLVHFGDPLSTDRLIEALWGEHPPRTAEGTLHTYLSHLRALLEPERAKNADPAVLVTAPAGYLLAPDAARLDSKRFETAVAEGRAHLGAGRHDGAAARLSEALAMWRGPPFGEFTHADFARGEASRLEQVRLGAVEDRIDADLGLGLHHDLLGELGALVEEHPLRERLWGQLMTALYRDGRQADALRAYQRVRRLLGEELGIEPGPELRDLESRILLQDETLAVGRGYRTAGDPRLGSALPSPVTSFVGRELEMSMIADAVRDSRLVTLTGVGGIGKSRLAAEVVRTRNVAPKILYVSLTEIEPPGGAIEAVADAAGVRPDPDQLLVDALEARIRDDEVLVVIDDADRHLPEITPLLARLLSTCPGVRALQTCRAPLGIRGETVIPVPPMGVPPPEERVPEATGRYDAVDLFVVRARAASPGFRLNPETASSVGAVCARLGGLPLAIELAASRVRVLSPEQILENLDELVADPGTDPRRGSLSALLRWSYDALPEAEQAVFRRLGVFSGGFTLDMAQRVLGEPPSGSSLIGLLGSLVDHALITVEPGRIARYTMLELARHHAREVLREAGEAEAYAAAHADYFAERAREIDASFGRAGWLDTLVELDLDLDVEPETSNFRRALSWAVERGDRDRALTLAGGLGHYWKWRGKHEEAARWMTAALSLDGEPSWWKAKVLREFAGIERLRGNLTEARVHAEQAVALFAAVGDDAGRADALYDLGFWALLQGDYARADHLLWECVALWERLDAGHMTAFPLVVLAWKAKIAGEYERAEELWDRILSDPESMAARSGIAFWRADLAVDQGDLDRGRRLAEEAIAQATDMGIAQYAGGGRTVLARIALLRGDLDEARSQLAGASLDVDRSRSVEIQGLVTAMACRLALASGDPDDADRLLARAVGLARAFGGPLPRILLLDLEADIADARQEHERAVRLHARSSAMRERHSLPLPVPEGRAREEALGALRGRVARFDEVWAAASAGAAGSTGPTASAEA